MWLNLTEKEIGTIKRLLRKHGKKDAPHILERIEHYENPSKRAEDYKEAAAKKAHEGELEIDGDAVVSMGGDPGAYVMAWVWVSDDELPGPRDWSPRS